MKKKRSANEGVGYDRFSEALKTVLSVSHSQMKSRLAEAKEKRTKKSSASHVLSGSVK